MPYQRIPPRLDIFIDRKSDIRDFILDLNDVRQGRNTVRGRNIASPPSSGKSRLLEELIDRANRMHGILTHHLDCRSEHNHNTAFTVISWLANILNVDIPQQIYASITGIVISNRHTNDYAYVHSRLGNEEYYTQRTRFLNGILSALEDLDEIPEERLRTFYFGREDLHFDFDEDWLVCFFFSGILDITEHESIRYILKDIISQLNTHGLPENLRNYLDDPNGLRQRQFIESYQITPAGIGVVPQGHNTALYATVETIISVLRARRDALNAQPPLEVTVLSIDDIHLAHSLDCNVVNLLMERLEGENLSVYIVATLCDNSLFPEFFNDTDNEIIQIFDNKRKKDVIPFDRESAIELFREFLNIISREEEAGDTIDPTLRIYDNLYMPELTDLNQALVGSKRFPSCIWCVVFKHLRQINTHDIIPLGIRNDCNNCDALVYS